MGKQLPDDVCAHAAEKSSIYTYPAAVLPILNPLMKALAYLFPDKGIRQVGTLTPSRLPLTDTACSLPLIQETLKSGLRIAIFNSVSTGWCHESGTGAAP